MRLPRCLGIPPTHNKKPTLECEHYLHYEWIPKNPYIISDL